MRALDIIDTIAGTATAVGVAAAVLEVFQSRRQARGTFEQDYVHRYRQVIARLPLDVLIDDASYDPTDGDARRAFYDYFELCNDEAFQCAQVSPQRVSDGARDEWIDGVRSNFRKASFRAAWADLGAPASHQFKELKESGWIDDLISES